jgi:hypothetical protein
MKGFDIVFFLMVVLRGVFFFGVTVETTVMREGLTEEEGLERLELSYAVDLRDVCIVLAIVSISIIRVF